VWLAIMNQTEVAIKQLKVQANQQVAALDNKVGCWGEVGAAGGAGGARLVGQGG
jgi:hypothetical protein